MKKGKCKAFSSSSTLLWNFSLFSLVLPSFLFLLNLRKKAQVFKEIYRIMYKKSWCFCLCWTFLLSKNNTKKSTHNISEKKMQKAKKKNNQKHKTPNKQQPQKGRFWKTNKKGTKTWISYFTFYALWLVALLEIKQSDRQK